MFANVGQNEYFPNSQTGGTGGFSIMYPYCTDSYKLHRLSANLEVSTFSSGRRKRRFSL